MQPFTPAGGTTTVAATTTSGQGTVPGYANQLEIQNAGPGIVFARWGVLQRGALVATTGDYPILAGQSKVVTKGDADTVALISDSTAVVYLTAGAGL